MRNPMFEFDEAMTDLILEYCRERLVEHPVPLDYGGVFPVEFAEALSGLLGAEGNDPAKVLALYSEQLAPAIVSADSPRFLSFIPAAPTKASLLFDMVVSCSALHATSWLEAAGAVAAENQALRLLADLAGLPAGAGGCFVSGGSLGNLSAWWWRVTPQRHAASGLHRAARWWRSARRPTARSPGPSTSSGPMRSWSPRWTTA